MIKVIVVEDIKPVREGLAALIDGTPEFTCLNSYDSCESMLSELEQISPDVILLDIQLNGMTGIEGIPEIKKILPNTNIVMLTIHEDNKNIFEDNQNEAGLNDSEKPLFRNEIAVKDENSSRDNVIQVRFGGQNSQAI